MTCRTLARMQEDLNEEGEGIKEAVREQSAFDPDEQDQGGLEEEVDHDLGGGNDMMQTDSADPAMQTDNNMDSNDGFGSNMSAGLGGKGAMHSGGAGQDSDEESEDDDDDD
jgi:hypothetical protein